MSFQIADIYLKDKLVTADTEKEKTDSKIPDETKEIKLIMMLLVSYCGKYEWQPGIFVTILNRK